MANCCRWGSIEKLKNVSTIASSCHGVAIQKDSALDKCSAWYDVVLRSTLVALASIIKSSHQLSDGVKTSLEMVMDQRTECPNRSRSIVIPSPRPIWRKKASNRGLPIAEIGPNMKWLFFPLRSRTLFVVARWTFMQAQSAPRLDILFLLNVFLFSITFATI